MNNALYKLIPILIFLLLSVPPDLRAQEAGWIAGYWDGAFVRANSVLPVSFEFVENDTGFSAIFIHPDYAPGTIKQVQLDGSRLSLKYWFGEMSLVVDSIGEMRGILTGRDSLETFVHLRKSLKPTLAQITTEEITFRNGDVTLAGTLVLPAAANAVPAFVFVQGRGYGSRRQFLRHAIEFARRGIVGLVFDGRGRGGSGGDRKTMTAEDRINDVVAALNFVSSPPEVDGKRLGVWGHSAGGWIVPVVAQRFQGIQWMILQVGPAERLDYQQGHVVQAQMKRSGKKFSDAEFKAAFEYQAKLVAMSRERKSWEEIARVVETAKKQPWAGFVDIPESYDNSELDFFRREPYDNEAALGQLKIPLLAIYGEKDWVVSPEANLPKLKKLMEKAGNSDYKIVVFPGVGHGMAVDDGMRGEGLAWPEHYYQWGRRPLNYFQTIFEWLLPRVGE